MKPQDVTKEVTASGIHGHGGAAFPAGRKWAVIKLNDGQPHYLCAQRRRRRARHVQGPLDPRARAAPAARVDADRGLRAAGAQRVRLHPRRVRPAVPAAGRRGRGSVRGRLLGERILGTDFACDLVVYRGAGSYVCGEASGLLTSIEGKRGYPRNRPPRLTVQGLYQRPTVVNNVETLSNVAGSSRTAREAFKQGRHAEESGHAARLDLRPHQPAGRLRGRVRLPAGRSSSTRTAAGSLGGRTLKCVIPGGISTKVLTGGRDRAAHLRQRSRSKAPARRSARAA